MSNIERRTIINRTEFERDGKIFLVLLKQRLDGEEVVRSEILRIDFEPGADLEAAILVVQDHLKKTGEAEVEASEWDRARRLVASEHTPECIAAFMAKQALAAERMEPEVRIESCEASTESGADRPAV
jgi:hypothetical protein